MLENTTRDMPTNDHDSILHRSHSVAALKMLGKKLLSPRSHQQAQTSLLDNYSGIAITPLRGRAGGPPAPLTSVSRSDNQNGSGTRHRSGSIFSKKKPVAASPPSGQPLKTSPVPASLISHSTNPFLAAGNGNFAPLSPSTSISKKNRNASDSTNAPGNEAGEDGIELVAKPHAAHRSHRAAPLPLSKPAQKLPLKKASSISAVSASSTLLRKSSVKLASGAPAAIPEQNPPSKTFQRSKSFILHNNNAFGMTSLNSTGSGVAGGRNFVLHDEKNLVYNPYGINPNAPSRSGTTFSSNNNDLSFYLHDGDARVRMLPLPIADPNDYLPDNMKQFSVQLTDNFIFDTDNKTIGSGGSSEVRKIRLKAKQKNIYALKKLNMVYDETPEKFYKRCSKEFIIGKELSHSVHITSTFFLVKVPTTTYTTRGWGFVMELGKMDLFQLIERSGWKSVPLSEKYCLFKQICNGVKFMHDNGVAHRDLKPENVLLSMDGICKLTDFGISDWYHEIPHDFSSPVKQCRGMIGSPPYVPPEVMMFDSKKHYPEKLQKPFSPLAMDCFALGIILFTLVNGMIPFIESCSTDARFRDFESSYASYVKYQQKRFKEKNSYRPGPGAEYSLSRNFKTTHGSRVAWRLCDPDPETRYTMDELFNDPWFTAIQTCVDPNTQEHRAQIPVLKNIATGDGNNTSKDVSNPASPGGSIKSPNGSTDFVAPSPTTAAKRSMVEIAQSPVIPTKEEKEDTTLNGNPNESTANTVSTEMSGQTFTNDNTHSTLQIPTGDDIPANLDDILSSPTEPSANNSLTPSATTTAAGSSTTTQGEEKLGTPESVLTTQSVDMSTPLDVSASVMRPSPVVASSSPTTDSAGTLSRASSLSPSSIKKVIHYHLDVPSSVTR